jgi:hypothetical protein
VRFAVSVAPCTTIRAAALDGECDLGLLLEERPPDHLRHPDKAVSPGRVEIVSEVPLIVFCGPSHPLLTRAGRSILRLDELTPYTVFISDGAGAYHDMLTSYLTTGRLPGPRVEASGSVEATRIGVLADQRALGILPAYAVAERSVRVGAGVVHRAAAANDAHRRLPAGDRCACGRANHGQCARLGLASGDHFPLPASA